MWTESARLAEEDICVIESGLATSDPRLGDGGDLV